MSRPPIFTQKHYEKVIKDLQQLREMYEAAGVHTEDIVTILCDIFAKDNPNFKPDLFRQQCKEEKGND